MNTQTAAYLPSGSFAEPFHQRRSCTRLFQKSITVVPQARLTHASIANRLSSVVVLYLTGSLLSDLCNHTYYIGRYAMLGNC